MHLPNSSGMPMISRIVGVQQQINSERKMHSNITNTMKLPGAPSNPIMNHSDVEHSSSKSPICTARNATSSRIPPRNITNEKMIAKPKPAEPKLSICGAMIDESICIQRAWK
uniref:Uncharacterized protein n=1 Tax=Physcomitrium patens TaxID=3218 RepID=A0A2K1J862_PHYPA|nr:hypothetical protein PHYPA_020820 [Physcomitrium patens]